MNKTYTVKSLGLPDQNLNWVFNNQTRISLCEEGLIKVFGYYPKEIKIYTNNPKKKGAKKIKCFNYSVNVNEETIDFLPSAETIIFDFFKHKEIFVVGK